MNNRDRIISCLIRDIQEELRALHGVAEAALGGEEHMTERHYEAVFALAKAVSMKAHFTLDSVNVALGHHRAGNFDDPMREMAAVLGMSYKPKVRTPAVAS